MRRSNIVIYEEQYFKTNKTYHYMSKTSNYKTLTLQCIMSQNGQTYFKNLAAIAARFLKMCLTIMGHYALKG